MNSKELKESLRGIPLDEKLSLNFQVEAGLLVRGQVRRYWEQIFFKYDIPMRIIESKSTLSSTFYFKGDNLTVKQALYVVGAYEIMEEFV